MSPSGRICDAVIGQRQVKLGICSSVLITNYQKRISRPPHRSLSGVPDEYPRGAEGRSAIRYSTKC